MPAPPAANARQAAITPNTFCLSMTFSSTSEIPARGGSIPASLRGRRRKVPRNNPAPFRHSDQQAGAEQPAPNEERDMTNWILSTAIVAMSVTAAVGAQSAAGMGKPAKGDTMSMTYTGCVESVNHGGTFLLTRVDHAGMKSTPGEMAMEHHGEMAMEHHDEMAMKGDAARTMPEQTPMADGKMDAMP